MEGSVTLLLTTTDSPYKNAFFTATHICLGIRITAFRHNILTSIKWVIKVTATFVKIQQSLKEGAKKRESVLYDDTTNLIRLHVLTKFLATKSFSAILLSKIIFYAQTYTIHIQIHKLKSIYIKRLLKLTLVVIMKVKKLIIIYQCRDERLYRM